MNALVRTSLLLALSAAPLLSFAQEGGDAPWWKRLFKQETVEAMDKPASEVPTDSVQTGSSITKPSKTAPMDRTPIDSSLFSPSPVIQREPGVVSIASPALVDSLNAFRKENPLPLGGYRIQIFQGSVAEAKAKRAEFVKSRAKDPVHLVQTRPYFAIRVGDFRTELEAYKRLMELRELYPGAYVVADRIEMPPLD